MTAWTSREPGMARGRRWSRFQCGPNVKPSAAGRESGQARGSEYRYDGESRLSAVGSGEVRATERGEGPMASRGKGQNAAAWAAIAMAVGLCGLGLLSLFYRDFAMVWQPVPKSWPNRPELATASGLILLAGGAVRLFPPTPPPGPAPAPALLP